jgi:hypothetical protein
MIKLIQSLIPNNHQVISVNKINNYDGLIKVNALTFPFVVNGYKIDYYVKLTSGGIKPIESYQIDKYTFKQSESIEPILL